LKQRFSFANRFFVLSAIDSFQFFNFFDLKVCDFRFSAIQVFTRPPPYNPDGSLTIYLGAKSQ
jgi:hypothetical protein